MAKAPVTTVRIEELKSSLKASITAAKTFKDSSEATSFIEKLEADLEDARLKHHAAVIDLDNDTSCVKHLGDAIRSFAKFKAELEKVS